jgi:hypothetical protein
LLPSRTRDAGAMVTGLEFRSYRPGDEYAINDGFNAVFDQRRTLAEWHWKFAAPEDRRHIMLAVDAAGAVMVHYGAIPVRLQCGGVVLPAGQIVDVYTRMEARRGLAAGRAYLTTYNRFVADHTGPERLAACYGFPGDRALRFGVMRFSYDDIEPWAPRYLARETVRRPGRGWGVEIVRGFDAAAIDALWERARVRYPLAVVRDAEHYRRRFLGRPGVEYVHLVGWRQGRPEVVAVVREGAPFARLADLLWDGRHERSLVALDRAVTLLARRRGATGVDGWLDGDEHAAEVLGRLGWTTHPNPLDLRTVVRVFHPAIDPARVAGRLYLTLGDSDLV